MSASMEVMPPGGHETYATSIFSKIKTYLDSNPYKPVKDIPNTPTAIASFDDGSNLPMPKLEVAIEPQQEGSGDPSPTNIRPISGWDEVNVSVSGVNIWDEEWRIDQNQFKAQNLIPVMPNTTYYFKCPVDVASAFKYDKNKNALGILTIGKNTTFTTGADVYFIWFALTTDTYGTTYNNDISINYPSTDTQYHAYNGQTYNIQFKDGDNPLTVYGGTLDVVSGELTVDSVMIDLGSCAWDVRSESVIRCTVSAEANFESQYKAVNGICSAYIIVAQNSLGDGKLSFNNSTQIYLRDSTHTFSTQSDAQQYLNGQKLVYELATPTTIQLTPTQVKSLLGINNIWADTGDILDAEYIRDKYDNITAKYAAYAYNSGNAYTATSATTASKLGSSNVGSATQPIYLNGGTATACTYTLGKSVPSDAVFTDTKNTAGSTDTSSKIFLIGATSQAANLQTYSQDTAYVGTDGCLYSGGTKVLTAHQDISGKADKSATVSTVAWSNNKLTKTINGTTSDVVSAATILGNLTSSQVTTALGYTPASVNTTYDFESPDDSISFNGRAVGSVVTVDMTVNGKVSTEGDTISGDYVNTADFSEGGVYGKRVTTYGPWGIDVEEYLADSLWSRLSLRDSDILLTKTWDGTNTSLKSSISSLKQSLSQLGELIWTNNNPSNTFAGQTLNNLDLSKYSFLLVVYKRWITAEDYEVSIIYKDKKSLIKSLVEVLNYRIAECTNTSITWSDSIDYQTYGNNTKTVQNNRNVPYKIFGLF